MLDGGVFLGRNPATGLSFDSEAFAPHFLRSGFQSAVAASYRSIFFDFRQGNNDVLDLSRKLPGQIIPALVIPPVSFDEVSDSEYLQKMKAAGARVLGFYQAPKYNEIPLDGLVVRHLAKVAGSLGYVLQFGLQTVEELPKVLDYHGHLECPILIRWMSGRVYKNLADMIHVLRSTKNIYFDVGSVVNGGGIRFLANRVGTERLYYCSNRPEALEYPSRFMMEASGLDASSYAAVMGENLENLFGVRPLKKSETSRAESDASKKWTKLAKFKKIDTHVHVDGWNILEPEIAPEFIKKHFSDLNYEAVLISPVRGLNDDLVEANLQMKTLVESEKKFFGMIVVDPLRLEDSIRMIDLYASHPKFLGLKSIQDLYDLRLDAHAYDQIFELAKKFQLPVMAHIPGMADAAKKYPEIKFICAHSTWGRVKSIVQIPNIYFDIATSHNDAHETRLGCLVQEAGEDRILFSCDAQLIHPAWTLGKLASYDFSDATLEKIFLRNALAVFPKLAKALR